MRALIAVCLVALAAAGQAPAAPNIVLVVTDDQRWDTLSAMPAVQSELVGKGVTFSNAFAVNPLCCPSRASILSGRYSHSTGVWGNWGYHVFDDRATVATRLVRAGYRTAFVGKYLNSYAGTYVPPGWLRWTAFSPSNAVNYHGYTLNRNGRLDKPAGYSTDVLADDAVGFLESTRRPFFLVFAPYAPHGPADPAERHADAFAGMEPWRPANYDEADVTDKPSWVRAWAPLSAERAAEIDAFRTQQLRSLLAVDDAVARIVETLERDGRLADTLILFTSDNGFLWGEHRLGGKQAPYEESIRVPLVARYDRLGLAARTEPRFALNVDLAPTIARAASVTLPAEGRSLLPLMAGTATSWRDWFLIESKRTGPGEHVPSYCGIRSRRYVYVAYGTRQEELYDLATDPGQLENLAAVPAQRARLVGLRRDMLARCVRPPAGLSLEWVCTRRGTRAADRLRGTWRLDALCGGSGRDTLRGGRGNDRLMPGPGRDRVWCGSGVDRVFADRFDVVADDCEIVRRV